MKRTHGARLAARREAQRHVTYSLYGVARRDPRELVGMFFATEADRDEFVRCLPGTYRTATLLGVDYDALDVVL